MPELAVDTHAIVWYLSDDPRLSARASSALDKASANGEPIFVPSICLVELTYLIEKGRLPADPRDRLVRALDDPGSPYMPDRIVSATALALRVPLVSRDGKIRASRIETIW